MRKRTMGPWNLILLFLMVLSMVSPAGCAPEQDGGEEFALPAVPAPGPEPGENRTGLLYYPDRQWRFLVPVHREIPEAETVVRNTLERLASVPPLQEELEPWGLVPLLPEGAAVLGIHLGETGFSRVDFSGPFLEYEPSRERLVLGGLFCTLRQFPEIERLEIMVEGRVPEKFPGGTPGGMPLGPECLLNLEVDDALDDYRNYTAVTVYFCFPTPQGRMFYVPVTRALPPVEDSIAAALAELLAGPRNGSGLFSDIPPGTAVRSVKPEEGSLTVDLSAELLAYGGGRTGAENMVNQLLLTLGRLEGVQQVQLLVEGKKVGLLEGIDLGSPLAPPEIYNFF